MVSGKVQSYLHPFADIDVLPGRSRWAFVRTARQANSYQFSTDEENAFFASGVHEDVLTYLSRVADLRVISRTSVATYAVTDLSLPEIGRELGVSHVVEGSVRRAGDRVRVTVQLIDAATSPTSSRIPRVTRRGWPSWRRRDKPFLRN